MVEERPTAINSMWMVCVVLAHRWLFAVHEGRDGDPQLLLPVALIEELCKNPLSPTQLQEAWLRWVGDIRSVDSLAQQEEDILALNGRVRIGRNTGLQTTQMLEVHFHVGGENHGDHRLPQLTELLPGQEFGHVAVWGSEHDTEGASSVKHLEDRLVIV